MSLQDKMYVLLIADMWDCPSPWIPEGRESQTLDTAFYTVGFWFCFDLIVIVPWFGPLGDIKVCNLL